MPIDQGWAGPAGSGALRPLSLHVPCACLRTFTTSVALPVGMGHPRPRPAVLLLFLLAAVSGNVAAGEGCGPRLPLTPEEARQLLAVPPLSGSQLLTGPAFTTVQDGDGGIRHVLLATNGTAGDGAPATEAEVEVELVLPRSAGPLRFVGEAVQVEVEWLARTGNGDRSRAPPPSAGPRALVLAMCRRSSGRTATTGGVAAAPVAASVAINPLGSNPALVVRVCSDSRT